MIGKILTILFALALLAGTAFAGSVTLTETELDGITAQGLQTIENDNGHLAIKDQDNNLDSVQLNNSAEQDSIVNGIINTAKSAVNASANILMDYRVPSLTPPTEPPIPPSNKEFGYSFHEENINIAKNHDNEAHSGGTAIAGNLSKETQSITNGTYGTHPVRLDSEAYSGFALISIIKDQDNNNNSVQLNDNAQRNSQGVSIINSSNSALNFGANYFVAGDVTGSYYSCQKNIQVAKNMCNEAGAATTAVAGNAEEGPTQTINNVYAAEPTVDGGFIVPDVEKQENNNNSVQVNGNAQENAIVMAIMNSAQSATNASANMASMGDTTGLILCQKSVNIAENHVNEAGAGSYAIAKNLNKETQHIHNYDNFNEEDLETFDTQNNIDLTDDRGLIENQDNNNNSVQLNESAQGAATGILLENSALSAVNASLNLIGTGDVTGSILGQSNKQVAKNFVNEAGAGSFALAANAELSDNPGQWINNLHAEIKDQDNNNNSVQLNNNAQGEENYDVDMTINSADSAVNVGQNTMSLGNVDGSLIRQSNDQEAENHNNYAHSGGLSIAANINKQTQYVYNCLCTDLSDGTQDNNMNSVQLNDNAQQNAVGMVMVNSAESAVNGALNLIVAGTVSESYVYQCNKNVAVNFSNYAKGSNTAIAGNAELGSGGIGMVSY
jgi:hypothetical protein